jgi:uncharacterized protein YjdB
MCEEVSASVSVSVVERPVEPLPEVHPHPPRVAGGVAESQPWDLPSEPLVPEPRRSRSRRGWVVAAGAAILIAGGFWLAGDRQQPEPAVLPETAVAAGESTPGSEPDLQPAAFALAPESKPSSSVTITQRPAGPLLVGGTGSLAAEVRDAGGSLIDGARVGWESTDSSVVSVDSVTGAVRAVGPGRAQVIAVAGSSRDSARIIVRPASKETPAPVEPASLSIATHEPLRVGDTATLELTALDQRGKPVRPRQVTWSSSEPQVAEVHATTGRVRAHAAGSTLLIARSGSESAITSLTVLPPSVASVTIVGARPLKVGDTLVLRAEPKDFRGRALADRSVEWGSSEPAIAPVDSAGVVIAAAPGSTEIRAASEGKAETVRVTVLPQPRTSRSEVMPEPAAQRTNAPVSTRAVESQQLAELIIAAGVEECYNALERKDVGRVGQLYNAVSKSDQEKLKKLSRILATREWDAEVGAREDGMRKVEGEKATMEFGFQLSWQDAFGGKLSSRPVFRAEFTQIGGKLDLASCRIINSPKL